MARTINVKLILGLRHSGMSMNDIAAGNHISKHSVSEVCRIAKKLGITEEEVSLSDNEQLYRRFFPDKRNAQRFYEPVDYDYVHREGSLQARLQGQVHADAGHVLPSCGT